MGHRMKKDYVIILMVCGGLFVHGCAGGRFQYSREEAQRKTRDELWVENEKLKISNAELQKQIAVLGKENQRIIDEGEGKLARLREENQLLSLQIKEITEENQRIVIKNQVLAKKLAELQHRGEPRPFAAREAEKEIGTGKIKVLSGDGNLLSAKEMAGRLEKMGYRIRAIDLAPHASFSRDTVYFAPGFRGPAKALVSSLGGKATLKPLSWPSIFNLIIVTGRNP
jgi:hypothetical protein